jgi:SlyX.
MEARLTEIEIKLTQMEDLLDALNLTVYRQQETIARLQQQHLILSQQMHDMAQMERRTPVDETPPHY